MANPRRNRVGGSKYLILRALFTLAVAPRLTQRMIPLSRGQSRGKIGAPAFPSVTGLLANVTERKSITSVAAMPNPAEPAPTKAVLTGAEPQLFVADMKVSCDFFTGKLGFAVVFTYGEPPFYAQVKRDGARINLRCVDRPVFDPALRERESLLSAAMTVASDEEIEQLFLEFQSAGVDFHQTLRREPWGAKNFVVRDPDGNLLLFAGPAE
jgi:catechol 2,3-dioxygenase-like lactoylglutathione lyase family enzyme